MVECGVPVAERSVEAAKPDGEVVTERVTDLQSLKIDDEPPVLLSLEYEFDHRPNVGRELGRKIEVEGGVEKALVSPVSGEICADIGKPSEECRGLRRQGHGLRDSSLVL